MKKVFLLFLFSMFLVQSVGMASSAAVKDFRYNVLLSSADSSYLHMEIKLSGRAQKYDLRVNPDNGSQLLLTVFNTRLKNSGLKQIKLDGKIADRISFSEDGENVRAVIDLPYAAQAAQYKAYIPDGAERHAGPLLAIDVSKNTGTAKLSALRAVSGHTIVLDPGHGGSDSGAVGPDGIMEKNVTLAVAKKVYDILVSNGAAVVMTRTTDRDVYGPDASAAQELQARVNVAEFTKATDIFISIHANSFTNPSANGTETYYYGASSQGQRLASLIQTELAKNNGLTDRGVSEANFYVLKHTSMPSVLVEMAFISNYNEESLLNSEAFQTLTAQAICRGIDKYFQGY